jgi:hypothetical protein
VVWVGWLGSLLALASYALSVRWARPGVFHLGNLAAAALLVAYDSSVGAWPAAFLSVSFATIGVSALRRSSVGRRGSVTAWKRTPFTARPGQRDRPRCRSHERLM